MSLFYRSFLVASLLLFIPTGYSLAEWDCGNHIVSVASDAAPLFLSVAPDGSGDPFTSAALFPYGARVDATVTVQLLDCNYDAIAGYPAEDLWLNTEDYALVTCLQGSTADGPTDSEGFTHWTQPLLGGGASESGLKVYLNGDPLDVPPLPFLFNSPDLNGDRTVSLSDVSAFAADFHGDYDFRSDLNGDTQLSLGDVAKLAAALGANCP